MSDREDARKIAELLNGMHIASLTTMGAGGRLVSRPMSLQELTGDNEPYFLTARDSSKTQEISDNPAVNVFAGSSGTWVSLSGEAQLVDDADKVRELWNPLYKTWFPEGPGDPNITVIKVALQTVEYWDNPESKAATVFKMAASAVTGKPRDIGENDTLRVG